MRMARPLGLTEDGASLLVVTDDGEQIAVPVDERLTAALRGDRPRLGQLEIDMESQLRPREIQARVRAGETIETVALAAGVPVERVEPYAAPVLAERAHVVGMAIAGTVRRRTEAASTRGLKATVAMRLLQRGLDIDEVEWDAWKRPDGRWVVQASYASGSAQHVATFLFDLPGRFSLADNDEARWLIEESGPAHGPQPGRRRGNNPDDEPTVDLDDELALVRATLQASGPDSYGLSTLQDVHDYAPAELQEVDGVYDLVPPRSEMDVLYDMISGIDEDSVRIYKGLQQPVTPREEPEQLSLFTPEVAEPTRVVRIDPEDQASEDSAAAEPVAEAPAADAPVAEETAQPPGKRSRSKRASVPTWDEIMFGPKD
jgi:hypothetical protein